jgi:uncharacterized iron-regulated protein
VGWSQNWGGAFETYEPLVAFAKHERLELVALNPPKSLVRLVAREGLDRAKEEADWKRWKMQDETIVDDPLYRQRIFDQLRACHGGGSDDMYRTMYEASMVRDEGMARTVVALVESIRERSDALAGPIVSYTGGGHVQYNLPVANRVVRRLSGKVRQTSLYMTSYERGLQDDVREMLDGKIADYVWDHLHAKQDPLFRRTVESLGSSDDPRCRRPQRLPSRQSVPVGKPRAHRRSQ